VHLWTTTDDKMTQPERSGGNPTKLNPSDVGQPERSEWIAIARKHLLPRSWKIQETSVTESQRDLSFAVPESLIVKGPHGASAARPIDSAADLPGTEILSDLKQVSDKS
jgi:hypothetical protein